MNGFFVHYLNVLLTTSTCHLNIASVGMNVLGILLECRLFNIFKYCLNIVKMNHLSDLNDVNNA